MPEGGLHLDHLNLVVADVAAPIDFYRRWFGLTRPPRTFPDGAVFVTNDDGFDPALHAGHPVAVRRLGGALTDAGIEPVGAWDTAEHVSVKVPDPSGYVIEVYWDA